MGTLHWATTSKSVNIMEQLVGKQLWSSLEYCQVSYSFKYNICKTENENKIKLKRM